jgi:hypothetical protein
MPKSMSKKKADKAASSVLLSIFKPDNTCRNAAAKLASKSCDKGKGTKKACSTAGRVVGSKVTKGGKKGCKFYSGTK